MNPLRMALQVPNSAGEITTPSLTVDYFRVISLISGSFLKNFRRKRDDLTFFDAS